MIPPGLHSTVFQLVFLKNFFYVTCYGKNLFWLQVTGFVATCGHRVALLDPGVKS